MDNAVELGKNNVLSNPSAFEHCYRIAQIFADSTIVPEAFQKKPANVFVALQMAERLGLDAMAALQNIYIVKNRPCLSSQMLISLANMSGLIDGSIIFESNGKPVPEMAVTAKAKLKSGEVVSVCFCYRQAIDLGVTNNMPWKAMPEQMCRYRAASMLVKSYFPQVILGLSAKEEIEDLDSVPPGQSLTAKLDESLLISPPKKERAKNKTIETPHVDAEIIAKSEPVCESETVPF